MASNNMESNNVASKTYTGHTSLMFVFEHLKHEIFDDPVELAPLVTLTLGLLGQLHKVFHSLQMVRWRELARRNVSFNTFGTVLPKSPISILPAASPPIVMSNQTLCVTLGPFLASPSPPLPSRTITRISVAAQPIAWNPETIEIAPKGMKILSWMNRLIPCSLTFFQILFINSFHRNLNRVKNQPI